MSTLIQSKIDQFTQAFDHYQAGFNASLIGEKAKLAQEQLGKLDFPTSKTEYWKYTRVNKIASSKFSIQNQEGSFDLSPYLIPDLDCHTLVFVNGFYRDDLSCTTQEIGCNITPLSKAKSPVLSSTYANLAEFDTELFSAMNTAYPSDGAFISIDKNVQAAKPVHAIFLTNGKQVIAQPRNLIVIEQGAKLDIIISEFSMDDNSSFNNGISEILVGKNASVSLNLIQRQNDNNFLVHQVDVEQQKDSQFIINTISAKGGWIRNNLNIDVVGENCMTTLNGTYAPKGKSHVDNHTVVDHKVSHCESHELYKGIIYDQATAIFNGKVFVRPDAQLTNAFQSNANILMSDGATVNSKPELEIYADDVKCSHGSTVGQFDEDALFYLMARGISEDNAKRMMVDAFIGDVINQIADLKVREYVTGLF